MMLSGFYNFTSGFCSISLTVILCALISPADLICQSAHKLKIEGDHNYEKQDYSAAELSYRKAMATENDFQLNFNLGNSLIQQERAEEAADYFRASINKTKDEALQSKAWHNLGNALYKIQDFENSVEAYKNALRHNPDDDHTRRNLALAKKRLQNSKKDVSEDENEKNKDNEQSENDNNKNDELKQDQQEQNTSQISENKQRELPQSEIDKLLQRIEADENEIQKRVIKGQGKSEKRARDW